MSQNCPPSVLTLQEIEDQDPFTSYTTHSVLVAWLFFNVASSHFFLPLLIAGLSFTKPKVDLTIINVVITWIIYGLVSSILLYSGHAEGCEPPPILCLTQASLYIALPTMNTVSVLNAVLQIFFNVRDKLFEPIEPKEHSVRRAFFLVSPYCVYALFATVVAGSGASSFIQTVSRTRRFFYCSVRSSFLSNIIMGFCGFVLLATLGFSIWIVVMLYQNWYKLRRENKNRLDFDGIFRLLGFFIYTFIALGLAFLHRRYLVLSDMAMATMGIVIFIVFGTKPSVLRVLSTKLNCFYRRNAKATQKTVEKMHMVV